MPSIEESKNQVKATLENSTTDHDTVLSSLWDEIDKHNESRKGQSHTRTRDGEKSERSRNLRFRFKDSKRHARGEADGRRRRTHTDREKEGHRHAKRKREQRTPSPVDEPAAHPFPRKPADLDAAPQADSDIAFRESLFDALADDEGAAYWENVYSQPIHVYPRPTVETPAGKLEQMSDDEYAAYVQTKMWEKAHPEIVQERQRKEKQRKEAEEAQTREREEFIRRKERAAWERAEKRGAKFAGVDSDGDQYPDYEYVFDHEGKTEEAAQREPIGKSEKEYAAAWESYMTAWNRLKQELLDERTSEGSVTGTSTDPSKRIPWPVLPSKPVIRSNIEDFMRKAPQKNDQTRVQVLKAERVRWHPDKIQQRFGGEVDEGTMRLVTGVFQVVDSLLEAERQSG